MHEEVIEGMIEKISETEKETVKQKVLDYIREHKKSDITELHKNIGCDIRLLVEIIDELRREGKIDESDEAHNI